MFLPSALKTELEVHCDDDRWNHLGSTTSRHGLQRHLSILLVEILPFHLEVLHWNLRSLRVVRAFVWVLVPSASGNMNSSLFFVLSIPLSRWFSEEINFWCVQLFPDLPNLIPEYLISRFSPRSAHSQKRYLVLLSCQIDKVLINLALKSDDDQPLLQKEVLVLCIVLQIAFHTEFSRLPGGLGHFADGNSIP